ncbi:MAG: prepilin-type N-terminal cleavage/methylation domain-containing protein [Armatimonadetes bacterium]|nr:prepilin-type N-terminal cleavage/methylation domain-containing protein [Armatimonadota bacterium]MDW8122945.1 prepilin-type N-terminal cleavage/methylation domain-containing protein [Armatimonadota bacterium]
MKAPIGSKARANRGVSLMEVLTAIAILSIGIWALVSVFPTGQRVIRTAGVRQIATQLAKNTVSDFVSNPQTAPFAILPYDPSPIPNQAVLEDPSLMVLARRHYRLVWGEPLELIFVTPVLWRALVRYMPATPVAGPTNWRHLDGATFRLYREVTYRQVPDPDPNTPFADNPRADPGQPGDFTFVFNGPDDEIALPDPVNAALAAAYPRVLRVTYLPATGPASPVSGQLFVVDEGTRRIQLPVAAVRIERLWEEYPIFNPARGDSFVDGVLSLRRPSMGAPEPFAVPGASPDQLGPVRMDYTIDDPFAGGGHWLVETGPLVTRDDDGDGRYDEDPVNGADDDGDGLLDEDPAAFHTSFGGITNVRVARADPRGPWAFPLTVALGSDLESGRLFIAEADEDGDGNGNEDPINGLDDDRDGLIDEDPPLSAGTLVRVAYQTNADWFAQVIKPPDEFHLVTASAIPQGFPYEALRLYERNGAVLQFSRLLAGLSVQVIWLTSNGELVDQVLRIGTDGTVTLAGNPVAIDRVRGASVMVRVSGRPLWAAEPPRRRGDFVQLLFLLPGRGPILAGE